MQQADVVSKRLGVPKPRWSLAVLCFLAVALGYLDRVNLSVAIVYMADEFAWDPRQEGMALSAFFVGYLLTQILGGRLADRFGARWVLGIAVIAWSVVTCLMPGAASLGFGVFLVTRVLLGLGEGVTFPAIWSLYANEFPKTARTRAIAATVSAVPAASVLGLLITPLIVTALGWAWAFYAYGVLGILWFAVWINATRQPMRGPDERSMADGESQRPERIPLSELLRHKPVWAIVCAHFSCNWVGFVLLAWMPTYVTKGLGIDFAISGVYAMMPAVAGFIGTNMSGFVADALIGQGMNLTRVRKLITTVGFAGSGIALMSVGFVDSAMAAIAVMSVGAGMGGLALAGFAVSHIDIAPRHAGALMGVSNTVATLPGILGVYASGEILHLTGSWSMVFGLAGLVCFFGLGVYLRFGSAEKLIR